MQPGSPAQGQPPRIDNNMRMSVVSTVLFWPLGIPAIINAWRVKVALRRGDYARAQMAAAESRRWSSLALIIGLGIGLLCCTGGLVLGAIGGSNYI
jgi:hypothetical protein